MNASGEVGKTMMTHLDILILKVCQMAVMFINIKSNLHLALDPSTLITQPFLMTLCISISRYLHLKDLLDVRTQLNLNQHVQTLILPIPGVLCAAMITE